MTKKNAVDERFEKLEQDIQAMRLSTEEIQKNTDAKFEELKQLLVKQPRRRRGRPRPPGRRSGSGTKNDSGVIVDGEEDEDDENGQTEDDSSKNQVRLVAVTGCVEGSLRFLCSKEVKRTIG